MIKFSDKNNLALTDLDELAKQVDVIQKRTKTPTTLHRANYSDRALCTYLPDGVAISSNVDTGSNVDGIKNKSGRIKGVRIDSATVVPYIFKGDVFLPPAGLSNVDTCFYNARGIPIEDVNGGTRIDNPPGRIGTISSIEPCQPSDVDGWRVEDGAIFVPLANAVNGNRGDAGLIAGVRWVEGNAIARIVDGILELCRPSNVDDLPANYKAPNRTDNIGNILGIEYTNTTDVPRIIDGQIQLPPIEIPEIPEPTETPLANYNNSGRDDNPGTIASVELVSELDGPRIEQGNMILPMPSSTEYVFDPQYFVVDGENVSLNLAALNNIILEAADELEVEVTAEGVLTSDERGDLRFNTTTTDMSLANLTFDTEVQRA